MYQVMRVDVSALGTLARIEKLEAAVNGLALAGNLIVSVASENDLETLNGGTSASQAFYILYRPSRSEAMQDWELRKA
jgi:hypothetical protein